MFEMTTKGTKATQASARALKKALGNRSEPLRKFSEKQGTRWQQNFDSQGGIYGAWEGLRPSTEKRHGGKPMLVQRATTRSWVTAAGRKAKITASSLNWHFEWSGGKDGSLAVLHHTGFRRANTEVAPRIIFGFNEEDEAALEREMEAWVNRIVTEYFP